MAHSTVVQGIEAQPRIDVRVLGPFEVSTGGRRIDISSGRLRVLLAVLAMSAGQSVSVERLADAIWGEDLPENVRRTIQTYVTRLRQTLGAEAIGTDAGGYLLRAGPDDVDALRFDRLADRASTEADAAASLLAEALGLWRGQPFEDLDSDWLRQNLAPRLGERRLSVLERRLDLDLVAGRGQGHVAELRRLAVEHPMRESLWARLLIALSHAGRQADALETYEDVRVRIADELGVDPGPELQRIHAELLAGRTVLPAQPAADQPVVPRQLPADLGSFTGRSGDLAALDEILDEARSTSPTIVAIHGTGGAGKTALAVHWAHRVADRFPDGQLHLNLRGYGPGEPMAPAAALELLLRGLGVPGEQVPKDVEARSNLLRSTLSDRRVLMIVDNARDADQVRALLPGSGGTTVLVTSRSQLRGLVAREGAQRIAVGQLEPAESVTLLTTALQAHGVRPDPVALTELADRCGHLPLALAVAAERAGRHPDTGLAELVEELRGEQERLDALDAGDDTTDLRAVFDWSYRALDPDTARMFRLLGLHPGPDLSVPAAVALADAPTHRVRRLLDRLVDNNLLQRRRSGRYELHDLLRVYVGELAEQAPPDDAAAALDRLLDWLVHSARRAWRALRPNQPVSDVGTPTTVTPLEFDTGEQALAWFQAERTALVAAVGVAAGHGRHRAACRLSLGLWPYLYRLRAVDDLLAVLHLAADSAERLDDPAEQAAVAMKLGNVSMERSEWEASRAHLERACELYEQVGDRAASGRALSNLGNLEWTTGRLAESVGYHERAVERLAGAVPYDHALALNNLALAYHRVGRHDEAAAAAQRAVDLGRRAGLGVDEAYALDTLGQALLALGRTDEAIERLRRCRELLANAGARWEEGVCLTNLGRALRSAGHDDEARAVWTEALDIVDELGDLDVPDLNRELLLDLLASLPPQPSDQGHPSPGT